MKFPYVLLAGGLLATLPVRAVYAPVPEQEQGKELTTSIRAGYTYDSNIFGAASDEISSPVWQLAPRVAYNASATDQTFVSAVYALTLDHIENRPGKSLLDSHDVTLRLAHAFSPSTTLDLNNRFMVARNPESLLNGVPLNTDQSFRRNQFDGHFVTAPTPKTGVDLKVRSSVTNYRNATLGRSLDRTENLYGLAGNYVIVPELKGVAEYRHQDVSYKHEAALKDKRSDYLMAGVDYDVARKMTVSSRIGAEWRRRAAEDDSTAPFAELSAQYRYAENSVLTGGYVYTIEETSDPARFTDQKVHRSFVSLQHALSALIVASVSLNIEPTELQGREGVPNMNETVTRFGGALTYLPTKNWVLTASYDLDNVDSDDAMRTTQRHRVGVSASYTF